MKTVGVIAEYNPFHNGHKFHIEEAKRLTGADAAVIVMSGSYVQRGDAAIFDKKLRARAAILGGADLVIELPAIFAAQSAEIFARTSVFLMNALNCVDYLAFGAESEEISEIAEVAKFLLNQNKEFDKAIREKLKTGISYAAARAEAVNELLGEKYARILREPNNILAVEYLKALFSLRSDIEPILIKRHAVGHDDMSGSGNFASASLIREMIKAEGLKNVEHFVPRECAELYNSAEIHTLKQVETAILAGLRKSSAEEIARIADVSEGLENRIFNAAKEYATLDALIGAVKTKRYTHSRIRRIMLHSYLGITRENLFCRADSGAEKVTACLPRYLKILDFNTRGREILNGIKKETALPLVKNFAQLRKQGDEIAVRIWENELIFDSLYELCKIMVDK